MYVSSVEIAINIRQKKQIKLIPKFKSRNNPNKKGDIALEKTPIA